MYHEQELLTEIRKLNENLRLHQKAILDIDDLSRYTGLAKSTIHKYTHNSDIPYSKVGKKLFFDRSAVDAWILRNKYGEFSVSYSK